MKMLKKTALALCVNAALLSAASMAQEQAEEDSNELETIMVTAQKRTQNIQDVPVSVTAMTPKTLDVLGSAALDVRALSARVPSLLIESSFGRTFPRFYLRGIGNTDFDLLASQPVSLIYDEVVLENALTKGFPMFDMEQVEVLRGPQGTLFGRNTPAGIVKVASAKPSQDFDAHANFTYGQNGTNDVDVAIGGGITSTLSGRIALLSQERSDYIDNRAPGFEEDDQLGGFDEKAVKASLLWEPSDEFSALLMLRNRNAEADARIFRANTIRPGTNDLVSVLPDGTITDFDYDTVYQDAASRNRQSVDQFGFNLKMEWDIGKYTLTSISAKESAEIISIGDIDGGYGAAFIGFQGPGFIPFPSETGGAMPDHTQLTQEFRVASNDFETFNFQFGLFLFDEDLTVNNLSFDTLGGGVQNGQTIQTAKTKAYGVFASGDYKVTDELTITGGLRFSDDEKAWTGTLAQATPFSPLAEGTVVTDNIDDSFVSWDISASYKYSDTTNIYSRIAKGYRAPSIRGNLLFDSAPTKAESESIISGEVGFKSRIWDNTARLNGTVFTYQVSDQQITAVGGNTNVARLLNADTTNAYGFELDIEAQVGDDWFVTGGLSYNHTEIDDDSVYIAVCGGGAPFLSPHCTVEDPAIVRFQQFDENGAAIAGTVRDVAWANGSLQSDIAANEQAITGVLAQIDGNTLPQSPEWIANFTARYTYEYGDGAFFAYTDWAYRSKINFFLYESTEFTGDPLLEGGLRVGYEWFTDNADYEVAIFGRNITDEEQLTGGIDFNNLTGYANEPRFFGIEFISNFY